MNLRSSAPAARQVPGLAVLAIAIVVAGCSGAAATPSPVATMPAAPTPTAVVISREEAVARVLAEDPRFAGIGPLDPDLIGQAAWYQVLAATVGWRVVVTIGWGDCPAGCINRHTWVYDAAPDGTVALVEESGDPLEGTTDGGSGGGPVPPVAVPADGGPWIVGRALAGPVCPVVQDPPDPGCADRPVAGATVVIRDTDGAQVAEVMTGADGVFLVAVPGSGTFVVEAQPVEGLLGTPAPFEVAVPAGPGAWAIADLGYDTGIR